MALREKKHAIRLLIGIIALTLCVGMAAPVQAASSKNAKAHKAYTKQLQKDKKTYLEDYMSDNKKLKLYYTYVDLNQDGIDELITSPIRTIGLEGIPKAIFYTYTNGKVKELKTLYIFDELGKYYKKSHSFSYYYDFLPQDCAMTYYYKFNGKKFVKKAYMKETVKMKGGEPESTFKYFVEGKKVKKSKYQSYVKKLTKGDKGKSFSKLKWRKY